MEYESAREEYIFRCKVVNTVRQNLHMDVDLRDITKDMGDVVSLHERRAVVEKQFASLPKPVDPDVESVTSVDLYGHFSDNGDFVPHSSERDQPVEAMKIVENNFKNKLRRRNYRRRTRVLPRVVVALVHRLRAKFSTLTDTPSNRLMASDYLRRTLREFNFRDSDIAIHVDYAVLVYFLVPDQNVVKGLRM